MLPISTVNTDSPKITAETIRAMKGKKIPALTAYDYPMTRLLDEAGIPLILETPQVNVEIGKEDASADPADLQMMELLTPSL